MEDSAPVRALHFTLLGISTAEAKQVGKAAAQISQCDNIECTLSCQRPAKEFSLSVKATPWRETN
jgi:hypothetical protein